MNKVLLFLCLTLFFLFGFKAAKSVPIVGSDARWRYLGNDTFEITLVVYRRCTDGASSLYLPFSPPTLTADSCGASWNINLGTPTSYTVEDITPVCAGAQKLCPISGGSGTSTAQVPLGLERHTVVYKVYLGTFTTCCWYKLSWQMNYRNLSITTGLANTIHQNEFWLNRCVVNNSPRFINDPLLIRCAGLDVKYNFGMVDDENDSLTYNLSYPTGNGLYTNPWSFVYPLTCLGGNNPDPKAAIPTGFNLDSANGDIKFRPMWSESSVIKVAVTEWRKIGGVPKIIGVTNREFQILITQNCNNKIPALSGPFNY